MLLILRVHNTIGVARVGLRERAMAGDGILVSASGGCPPAGQVSYIFIPTLFKRLTRSKLVIPTYYPRPNSNG